MVFDIVLSADSAGGAVFVFKQVEQENSPHTCVCATIYRPGYEGSNPFQQPGFVRRVHVVFRGMIG